MLFLQDQSIKLTKRQSSQCRNGTEYNEHFLDIWLRSLIILSFSV